MKKNTPTYSISPVKPKADQRRERKMTDQSQSWTLILNKMLHPNSVRLNKKSQEPVGFSSGKARWFKIIRTTKSLITLTD